MIGSRRRAVIVLAVLAGLAGAGSVGGCASTASSSQPSFTFATPPPWAQSLEVRTKDDLPDEPRFRALREVAGCTIACRAADGRHVVLAQSPGFTSLQDKVRSGGQVVYTSPSGFRAWRGGPEEWYSEIILKSARSIIKDPPSPDRCGYVIESPAGEMAILAVNGQLKDDELAALIDSLVLSPTP